MNMVELAQHYKKRGAELVSWRKNHPETVEQLSRRAIWMKERMRNMTEDEKKRHSERARKTASRPSFIASHSKRFAKLGLKNHELFRPEVRTRALKNSAEECKTNPRRGPFPSNIHAESWHLRDPSGCVYAFRNLRHFIRTHRDSFTGRQLEEHRGKGGMVTRAETLLYQLSPRCKRPGTTRCGGWTWVHPFDQSRKP